MAISTQKVERDVNTYSYILANMTVPQIAYTNNNPGSPDIAAGTPITLENTTFHALAIQYNIDQSTQTATPAPNKFGEVELFERSFYNISSLPTLSADGDLVYKKYLEDNYRKSSGNVIIVDTNGTGNYTTIQSALNANTSGGELILVHPGTYNDTIIFTANDQIVTGFDSNPAACTVWQTSSEVVNGGSYTGCFVANMTFSITAATTVCSVVCSEGSMSMFRCNVNMTTAYSTGGLQPSDVSGGGELTFDYCNFMFIHTGSIGTDTKYHGYYTAGATLIYRHCHINMNCSGITALTTSGFGNSPAVIIIFDDNHLVITDLDADLVAGAVFSGTEDVQFSRNDMKVSCGNGNKAVVGLMTGTAILRGFNNHMHATYDTAGTAYVYESTSTGTLYSVGENLLGANGISNTGGGTLIMSSVLNGVFTATGISTLDNGLKINNATDVTKQLSFDCSGISTSTERVLMALNTNGSIATEVAIPASAGATGVTGSIAYQSGYLYVCVATDTWERTSIATW
jgi:hypothetical protein